MENRTETVYCTMCGKEFDCFDYSMGDNRFDILVNYPSGHDGERTRFSFCVDCFNKVLDMIIPMCKQEHINNEDWTSHNEYTVTPQ